MAPSLPLLEASLSTCTPENNERNAHLPNLAPSIATCLPLPSSSKAATQKVGALMGHQCRSIEHKELLKVQDKGVQIHAE